MSMFVGNNFLNFSIFAVPENLAKYWYSGLSEDSTRTLTRYVISILIDVKGCVSIQCVFANYGV